MYNLADLATGRQRPFRVIANLKSQEIALAKPYLQAVALWSAAAVALLPVYESGDATTLAQSEESEAARIALALTFLAASFRPVLTGIERWHRAKWIASAERATGVDISPWLMPVKATDAAIAEAMAFMRTISNDARARVSGVLLSGLRQGLPVREVKRSVNAGLSLVRKRATRAGLQQSINVVKELTRERAVEAEIPGYLWHHTPQQHPRLHHLARDGKWYAMDDPVYYDLGVPNCKCWIQPAFKP